MIKKIFKKIVNRETISYLIIGVLTTIVNWLVYMLFDKILAGNAKDLQVPDGFWSEIWLVLYQKGLAGVIAWIVAVVFAFFTNRIFVFESKAKETKAIISEAGKFVGSRLITGIIEIIGVPVLFLIGLQIQIFGLDLAKLIISVVVVVLNYIFSKFFVFKENKDV